MTLKDAGLGVVRRLRDAGQEAFWAGGCVRDMLLGLEPQDIDVATDAPPERIMSLFRRTRHVGVQFGVVLVRQGPWWIETATFRTDVDYQDGRRPEHVEFTTAEHDAERRDFTVNGLFYDPVAARVIDYVGGQADLKAGILRAIGDADRRFAEDHLRLLRAVRFAARFGFEIEASTAAAIREHAAHITRISRERIRDELEKILGHASRAAAVGQAGRLGLLEHLWEGSVWPADRLERAVRLMTPLPEDSDFVLGLAALVHVQSPEWERGKVGKWESEEVRRVGRALRCSNQQIADAAWLVEQLDRPTAAESMSLAAFKRLAAHSRFDDLLALHRAVSIARGEPLEANESARRRRDAIPAGQLAPPPLVTGDDLIAMGLAPGPRFGEILDVLYDAQLNEELSNRDGALKRLREVVAQLPG